MQRPRIWKVVFLFCSDFINHFIKASYRQQVWTWYLSHQNKTPDYLYLCLIRAEPRWKSTIRWRHSVSVQLHSSTSMMKCMYFIIMLSFSKMSLPYSQGISIKESWLHVHYVSVLCKHCVSPQTPSMSSSSGRWAAYSRLGTTSSAWIKCFCHSEPTNYLPGNAASPNSPLGCCQVARRRNWISVINSRFGW